MNQRIEKKADNKFLLLFIEEGQVQGKYMSKSDLMKLKSNVDHMLEFSEDVGDSL